MATGVKIEGSDERDELTGTNDTDNMDGHQKDDIIYGFGGDDIIEGGKGDDTIYGGEGNDQIRGESKNDILYGENGNDLLNGGGENDRLYGGEGDDQLEGKEGADEFDCGPGSDIILDFVESHGDTKQNDCESLPPGSATPLDNAPPQTNGSITTGASSSSSLAGSDIATTGLHNSFQVYQNPALGIRMEYPTEWQLREEPNVLVSRSNASVAFLSPLRDSGFRIEVADIRSQQGIPSLGPLLGEVVSRFSRQYPDFQVISTSATSIQDFSGNRIPAYQVVFSSTSPSLLDLEQQQFAPQDKRSYGMFTFTVHNNRSFLIEAYSEIYGDPDSADRRYSNNLMIQQRMLNSLKLV